MKLSKKRTDWILVKADTNSEWDTVDFILLNIGDTRHCKYLQECIEKGKAFKDDLWFYCLQYWCTCDGWYRETDDDVMLTPELDKIETWSYVKVTEKEIDLLDVPESQIDASTLKVFKDGTVQFCGSGKHSGEEYYSATFDLEQILNKVK